MTVNEVLETLRPYEPFLNGAHGGVTISGGEPLIQPDFVRALVEAFHREGFHVALDTNGFYGSKLSEEDWKKIDLILLDIKSFDPAIHQEAVEQPVAPVLATARRLADLKRPAWIRFVLVPGLTDQPHNVVGLADFVATLGNVERVEVLPFHQMGAYKWKELGLDYRLANTQPPTPESISWVQETFRSRGLEVV
jgi:pyruvate formate lyase activating enzyme